MNEDVYQALKEYSNSTISTIVRFRHAIGEFVDICSYFLNDKKIVYSFTFSCIPFNRLVVKIGNEVHYSEIIESIEKNRPRVIVKSVYVFDDKYVLTLDFNDDWQVEEFSKQNPEIKYYDSSIYDGCLDDEDCLQVC